MNRGRCALELSLFRLVAGPAPNSFNARQNKSAHPSNRARESLNGQLSTDQTPSELSTPTDRQTWRLLPAPVYLLVAACPGPGPSARESSPSASRRSASQNQPALPPIARGTPVDMASVVWFPGLLPLGGLLRQNLAPLDSVECVYFSRVGNVEVISFWIWWPFRGRYF